MNLKIILGNFRKRCRKSRKDFLVFKLIKFDFKKLVRKSIFVKTGRGRELGTEAIESHFRYRKRTSDTFRKLIPVCRNCKT